MAAVQQEAEVETPPLPPRRLPVRRNIITDTIKFRRKHEIEDDEGSSLTYIATLLAILLSFPALWFFCKWLLFGLDANTTLYLSALFRRAAYNLRNSDTAWRLARASLAGLGFAVLTGTVIYWDSADPGENPRSPFSRKNKPGHGGSGAGFGCHLAYVVTLLNGVAVAIVLALSSTG